MRDTELPRLMPLPIKWGETPSQPVPGMALCSCEDIQEALSEYRDKHGDQNFNGITGAALSERYGQIVHIKGRGFFRPLFGVGI